MDLFKYFQNHARLNKNAVTTIIFSDLPEEGKRPNFKDSGASSKFSVPLNSENYVRAERLPVQN